MHIKPIISVWIITYNQEKYISKCLDGVLMQIFEGLIEIIISDDCSNDNTFEICLDYAIKHKEKIRLYSNSKNVGLTKNWIETLKKCDGEYIAMCEGDDYWTDPNKLQKQYDFLKINPDYSAINHTVEIEDEAQTNRCNLFYCNEITNLKEAWNFFVPTCSLFFRNQGINHYFPTNLIKYPVFGGDKLLLLGLANQGKIKHLDDKMAVYRINPNSLSINQKEMQKLKQNISLIRFVLTIPSYKSIFIEARKSLLINHGNLSIALKEDREYIKGLKSLFLSFIQIKNYSDVKIFIKDFLIKFVF